MKSDQRTANALLAYFNHELAGQLVRKVLRSADPAAMQRLSTAILDLIPKAAQDKVWGIVSKHVEVATAAYTATDVYKKKVEDAAKLHADHYITQAMQPVAKERAEYTMRMSVLKDFHSGLADRYREMVIMELGKLAAEKAKETAK